MEAVPETTPIRQYDEQLKHAHEALQKCHVHLLAAGALDQKHRFTGEKTATEWDDLSALCRILARSIAAVA